MLEKLISDLIRFKTVQNNQEEFEKCFEYIRNYFNKTQLIVKEFVSNGHKSMVISNTEEKNLDVIFAGHIDVVPASDEIFEPIVKGNIIYGRGVFDMKGAVAVILKTLKHMKTYKKVAAIITSDEEIGGFDGIGHLLEKEEYTAKVAIVPDGGKDFELITEEKGVLQLKVFAKGVEAHASLLYEGSNAIAKLIKVYEKLSEKYDCCEEQSKKEFRTTINLSKMYGGDAINKVPGYAEMYLDIRHVSTDSKEDIINYIYGLNQDISIEIIAEGAAFSINTASLYVQKYIKVAEETLGTDIKIGSFDAASDGRFFAAKGIPTIIMNPRGEGFHKQDERLDLTSAERLYEIYMKYIREI